MGGDVTDTSTDAVERTVAHMRHCHGKDYSYAALIEALSAQLTAANARADVARDKALLEAAERFPCGRQPWPPNAIRKAILALRDKPAPAVTVRGRIEGVLAKMGRAAASTEGSWAAKGATISAASVWEWINELRTIAGGGDE